jgi:histidinol-phosphate aminotransferase
LRTFLASLPESLLVVLDEAYIDFVDEDHCYDTLSLVEETPGQCGVVLLRTFSKAYGLAGMRLGYGLMAPIIADCLDKVRQPFNVNLVAQKGALAALGDADFYQKTLRETAAGKRFLADGVEALGCTTYPSQTNFFLIDVHGDATRLYETMLRKGVIIRSMTAYGYPTFIRINVGTEPENRRFLETLAQALKECGYV